jgi:hypothetical protein
MGIGVVPLLLKKESDGKVSFTLATATIDKEAERSTKTTVQLSNIDAGAGGISLTANDKHVFNDKFNLSFAMRFARFGVGGFKGCFDVGIVVGGEGYVSICGGLF